MSQIAIWNLALGRLGDGATVGAPDERSRQAELCRQFYPLARRSVLEMRDWNFNTRTAALAPVEPPAAHTNLWQFAYAFPANALRVFHVADTAIIAQINHSADARRSGAAIGAEFGRYTSDFEIETDEDGGRIILSNTPSAVARYTVDVVDEARWSPLFTDAMTWYLASTLAGPLLLGETGRNQGRAMLQEFRLLIGEAGASDANQGQDNRLRDQHTPSFIGARN